MNRGATSAAAPTISAGIATVLAVVVVGGASFSKSLSASMVKTISARYSRLTSVSETSRVITPSCPRGVAGTDPGAKSPTLSVVVQHGRAGEPAVLQVGHGLGGIGHLVAVRCRPDAEPLGQPQKFFPVGAGVGGHAAQRSFLE